MIRTVSLGPKLDIECMDPLIPQRDVIERIEGLWLQALQDGGRKIFNGICHSLVEFDEKRLVLQPFEYKFLVAQRSDPETGDALALRPVGVTGLSLCQDGVVFGKRSSRLALNGGLWEAAPSGGLDRPDPEAMLFEELSEELGLERGVVRSKELIGLAEDTDSGEVDLVFKLALDVGRSGVVSSFQRKATQEYDDIAVVPVEDLAQFLASTGALLPALEPMLQLGGLIRAA